MLQLAAAAGAEMGAERRRCDWRRGVRAPSSVPRSPSSVDLHRLAGQRQRHEHLAALDFGDTLASVAEAGDGDVVVMDDPGLAGGFSSRFAGAGHARRCVTGSTAPAGSPFQQAGQRDEGDAGMFAEPGGAGRDGRDAERATGRDVGLDEAGRMGVELGHEQALVAGIAAAGDATAAPRSGRRRRWRWLRSAAVRSGAAPSNCDAPRRPAASA